MSDSPSRYADGQNTEWGLVGYGPDGRLIGVFPVARGQMLRIRDSFDHADDEWMTESYEVRPQHWERLFAVLSCPAPESRNSYFIEAFATDR